MADGDFEGNKLGIFDGHTLGEANRDLLGMTDGDFKGSISHQDAVETLLSSCMLDDLSCGKMCHLHFCRGFIGVVLALAFVAVEMRQPRDLHFGLGHPRRHRHCRSLLGP
mgnify:CR=1 FL=1